MRSKLLVLTTAITVGIAALAPATASAQRWHHGGGGWHGGHGGWHGGGWRGGFRGGYRRGWGPGIGAFAAGAIIGGALAAPAYGYYDGYYDAPPPVEVGPGPDDGDDAVAYCAQRFKSYDPSSGTYLGFDGARHPCP